MVGREMAVVIRACCLLLVFVAAANAACPTGTPTVISGRVSVNWKNNDDLCYAYVSQSQSTPQVVFSRFKVDFPDEADHPCTGVSVMLYGSTGRLVSNFTEDSTTQFTEIWSGADMSAIAASRAPYGGFTMKIEGNPSAKCRTKLHFTGFGEAAAISPNVIPGYDQRETPQLVYTQRYNFLDMTSPNWPMSPPNDVNLLYVVDIDYIRKSMICIKDLELPRNADCNDGYIWLHSNYTNNNLNIRLCGSDWRNNMLAIINGVSMNIPSSAPDRFGCVYRVVLSFGRKYEVLFDTTIDAEWRGLAGFKITNMDVNTTECKLPVTPALEYGNMKPGDTIPYSTAVYYTCKAGYQTAFTNNRLQCIENGFLDREPHQVCTKVEATTKYATRPLVQLTTTADPFGVLPSSAKALTPITLFTLIFLCISRLF